MSSPELDIELQRASDELAVVEYCTPKGADELTVYSRGCMTHWS